MYRKKCNKNEKFPPSHFITLNIRWPAIIEADPDTDAYYEAKNEKGGKSLPATPVNYKPHIHRLYLFIYSFIGEVSCCLY